MRNYKALSGTHQKSPTPLNLNKGALEAGMTEYEYEDEYEFEGRVRKRKRISSDDSDPPEH